MHTEEPQHLLDHAMVGSFLKKCSRFDWSTLPKNTDGVGLVDLVLGNWYYGIADLQLVSGLDIFVLVEPIVALASTCTAGLWTFELASLLSAGSWSRVVIVMANILIDCSTANERMK